MYELTQNKHGHIGYALIISNSRCIKKEDVERVAATYKRLGFFIKIRTNLTAEQMVKKMKKDAESSKFKDYSCFVCIILAHGNLKEIYGVDGKFFCLEQDIVRSYAECSSLTGKPKFFFVDVCEGELVGERFESYLNNEDFNFTDICIQYNYVDKNSALPRRQHDAHSFQIQCDTLNELATSVEFYAICRIVTQKVLNLGFQTQQMNNNLNKVLVFYNLIKK
jgi:caspase 3